VVGDEDDRRESWIPRVHAHGGEVGRVFALDSADGVALDLERDLPALEEIVREHSLRVIYLDAVLDHLAGTRNSHSEHDVRQALSPLRGLAHRLGVAVLYTLHANKMTGGTTRDRAGGSGQFTDVARSALLVGYHPEEPGVRVVARGKGNVGAVPPALRFRIDAGFMVNPETKQMIDVGVIAGLEPDPLILADDVCSQPPREREPTKQATAEDVLRGIGADSGWHSRKEAETACSAQGMSVATFSAVFAAAQNTYQPGGAWIETRQDGMGKEWRLRA
jgi:hypothetical protein